MRRLFRWLVNGLSLLSLLACMRAGWLWGRSYELRGGMGRDVVDLSRGEGAYWLASDRGRLVLCGQHGSGWGQPAAAFRLAGLEFASSRVRGDFLWNLIIPYPLLTPALALPPLLWLALRSRGLIARRRRCRLGLCLRCGYDLSGNTSGKCSECGEPVPQERRVTA